MLFRLCVYLGLLLSLLAVALGWFAIGRYYSGWDDRASDMCRCERSAAPVVEDRRDLA
jgi:hypothetical protein